MKWRMHVNKPLMSSCVRTFVCCKVDCYIPVVVKTCLCSSCSMDPYRTYTTLSCECGFLIFRYTEPEI